MFNRIGAEEVGQHSWNWDRIVHLVFSGMAIFVWLRGLAVVVPLYEALGPLLVTISSMFVDLVAYIFPIAMMVRASYSWCCLPTAAPLPPIPLPLTYTKPQAPIPEGARPPTRYLAGFRRHTSACWRALLVNCMLPMLRPCRVRR